MNVRKKILNILICYETNCSGETIATENIIQELKKHTAIHIDSSSSPPLSETSSWRYLSWVVCSASHWFKVISRRYVYDWVYTTTFTAGIAAVFLKPFLKYKICFQYHGSRIPPLPRHLKGKTWVTQFFKHQVVTCLHWFFIRSTDVIIIPSEYTRRLLLYTIPGVSRKHMIVIPNGVDTARFRSENNIAEIHRLKLKYGLPTEGPILASINILVHRKNILKLYTVATQLKKNIPSLIFIIVFPRPHTNEEQKMLRLLSVKAKAQSWIHFIENPVDLENIYNISTVVVSLTRQDHFPLILLESLASKTLFMATPRGAIRSLLNQIDPRLIITSLTTSAIVDQIRSVLSLPQYKLNIIREKERQVTMEYSWSAIASRIADALLTQNKD